MFSYGVTPRSPSRGPRQDWRLANANTIETTMASKIMRKYSSSDEDDDDERMAEEEGDQSRTDASEDSVEVRVLPITTNSICLQKNKRKLAEPRKLSDSCLIDECHPKARLSLDSISPPKRPCHPREAHTSALCHFRPWSTDSLRNQVIRPVLDSPSVQRNEAPTFANQEEPLSLVLNSDRSYGRSIPNGERSVKDVLLPTNSAEGSSRREEESCDTDEDEEDRVIGNAAVSKTASEASSQHSMAGVCAKDGEQKSNLRNYKNMTRERRMEANARERTRVHTISAAFDTLRRAVPSYAHNQRLSKLSVLRIACAYIVTLSKVAGKDYSTSSDSPTFSECVDMVTRTIQTEGKVRRRRDE